MMELPKPEHPVLAWDGYRWVRAMWVPKHTREQLYDCDDGWTDYNDVNDTYYWPEGWYELQHYSGDEMCWHIVDGVKCWQELPPRPGEQRKEENEQSKN